MGEYFQKPSTVLTLGLPTLQIHNEPTVEKLPSLTTGNLDKITMFYNIGTRIDHNVSSTQI